MSVELHCAWCWDCDDCGAENFERAVEGDATEAAMAIAQDSEMNSILIAEEEACVEGEPDCDGNVEMQAPCLIHHIALSPRHVVCRQCGATHESAVAKLEG